MVAEKGADRLRENQGIVDVLRHVLIGDDGAAVAEPGAQHMLGFVISDGLDNGGLQIGHEKETAGARYRSVAFPRGYSFKIHHELLLREAHEQVRWTFEKER